MTAGELGYQFKQAKFYGKGRSNYSAIWIVRHCTDDDEAPTYAEGLGNYLSSPALTRVVSAHFGVDSNSVMQYVKLADTAYGAGSPANTRGIHIEHSGLSGQTRDQWLDAFGQGLLEQSAQLHAKLHRLTGIPHRSRYLTDEELRDRTPGTTRHMDLVRVFGGTHDHCPGTAFPTTELDGRIAAILRGPAVTPTETQSVRKYDSGNDRVISTIVPAAAADVTDWTAALRYWYDCPHDPGSRMEMDHAWRFRALANDASGGVGRWERLTPGETVLDVPRLLGY